MANNGSEYPLTFKMIDLYMRGAEAILPIVRAAAGTSDLASAIAEGRIKRRGKIQHHFYCRIRADHLVITFNKCRMEIDYRYPKAFGANLMQRHIDLNLRLNRLYPEYRDLPLARDLQTLCEQGLIEVVDARDQLFELTGKGILARKSLRY